MGEDFCKAVHKQHKRYNNPFVNKNSERLTKIKVVLQEAQLSVVVVVLVLF